MSPYDNDKVISDTPRTDAAKCRGTLVQFPIGTQVLTREYVEADVARQLERELMSRSVCETCGCIVATWTQEELDDANRRAKASAEWFLGEVVPREHALQLLHLYEDAMRYRYIRSEASHELNGVWAEITKPDCNDERMDAAIDAAKNAANSTTGVLE